MVSRVDIITQLQDHFCGLADEMYQSIGVLQVREADCNQYCCRRSHWSGSLDVQTQADLRVCFDNLTEEQRKRQGLDTQKPLEPDQLQSLAEEYAQQVLWLSAYLPACALGRVFFWGSGRSDRSALQISRRSTRIDHLLAELPAQTSSQDEQLDTLAERRWQSLPTSPASPPSAPALPMRPPSTIGSSLRPNGSNGAIYLERPQSRSVSFGDFKRRKIAPRARLQRIEWFGPARGGLCCTGLCLRSRPRTKQSAVD
jgi:hypothetical protein